MWQNKTKNQNMTKLITQIVTKLISLHCDKTQKLKLWGEKNSTTQILKNSKTQIVREKNSETQMVTKDNNQN